MRLLTVPLLLFLPLTAMAEDVDCPDIAVTAQAPTTSEAQIICDAARDAAEVLERHEIPVPGPLTIAVLPEFDVDCVGVYHCGKDLIEVLSLKALAKKRSDNSIFAELSVTRYFASIILHEMVHAAYDAVPCPLDSCRATSEYLAYALQIDSFEPELKAQVAADIDPDATVRRDDISVMVLLMAPDRFALKAWSHFFQRPDPRAYVAQILSGAVLFDRFHP